MRELRNCVERLLLLADADVDLETVRQALPGPRLPAVLGGSLSTQVDAFEREAILAALARHNHNMTDTARSLGLERSHLYKKCAALGIRHRE